MKIYNLFIFFILIASSSSKLNLFRPFALNRQTKAINEQINTKTNDQSKDQLKDQQSDEKLNQTQSIESNQLVTNSTKTDEEEHQSLGQLISRAISRAINEIELELENRINHEVNEIPFELDQQTKTDEGQKKNEIKAKQQVNDQTNNSSFIKKDEFNKLNVSSIGINNISNDNSTKQDLIANFKISSNLMNSTKIDTSSNKIDTNNSISSLTKSKSTIEPIKVSNELAVREMTRLRSVLRTFGTIWDHIKDAFDELAESVVSRTATVILNAAFDRLSSLLFGI